MQESRYILRKYPPCSPRFGSHVKSLQTALKNVGMWETRLICNLDMAAWMSFDKNELCF